MGVKFLLKKFSGQVSMAHVSIIVLIPTFRTVSGYVISKYVYPTCVEGIAPSESAIWIGHTAWMSRFNRLTYFCQLHNETDVYN